ncbi:MAG TPA: chorismate-binding protein, partial [Thermoanaerobaculia bacterium]|nr:chorismate-binding protein [Thermoanaerobaculia bacterium]
MGNDRDNLRGGSEGIGVNARPTAALRCGDGWLLFSAPAAELWARCPAEVPALLAEVEEAAAAGLWAVGFVAYEAAPGFDAALRVRPPGGAPLAGFALFSPPHRARRLPAGGGARRGSRGGEHPWLASDDSRSHAAAVARIRGAIACGDTYQVNYTFRLGSRFPGDPWGLFRRLMGEEPPPHAGYLELGPLALCCASPELFFRLDGERLVSRPMKGTAPRGRWPAEDAARGRALLASPKERAENLMIVDMARHDLGRVARPGSVTVEALFALERYPTVWQLTSTVAARTAAPLGEVFRALFPAASITGAPKAAAMRLIAALEGAPRGVYTGAFGWVGPGRRASFAVAIRTATVDRRRGRAEYGTGGGVVWDSEPAAEHAESLLKAQVLLSPPRRRWELLETMLWRPRRGIWLRRCHLERLRASAAYFGFALEEGAVRRALARAVADLPPRRHRLRLRLARSGRLRVEAAALPRRRRARWRVALAAKPVDPGDPMLFHKTTERRRYDAARSGAPGADDVLLWNPRGELTESTVANLVVRRQGELVTPPLDCGLLPGTLRAHLLARGAVREAVVRVEELPRLDALWLVSSLRGWIPA